MLFFLFDNRGDIATLILLRLGVDLSSDFLVMIIFRLNLLELGDYVLLTVEVNFIANEFVFLKISEVVANLGY